jgi:YidC/Oxa1 family membrane protein insertase
LVSYYIIIGAIFARIPCPDSPFEFTPLHHPHSLSRVDGVPSLGWEQTIAFLSIPIFLTISQVISMNLMQPPKSDDPQQQQANVILKVLPFMVGWFALNVPAAFGIYWVVNNLVTTATTLYIRNTMPTMEIIGGGSSSGGSTTTTKAATTTTTNFNPTPMNERAVGFGGRSDSGSGEGGMKTITPAIDAEIVDDVGEYATVGGGEDALDLPAAPSGKRGTKKKKRR